MTVLIIVQHVGATVRYVEPLHSYSQYLCRLELDTPCYNEFT